MSIYRIHYGLVVFECIRQQQRRDKRDNLRHGQALRCGPGDIVTTITDTTRNCAQSALVSRLWPAGPNQAKRHR